MRYLALTLTLVSLFQTIPTRADATRGTLITDTNRRHPQQMMGSWGPHLRATMTDPRRKEWMVIDEAPSVLVNRSLRYFTPDGRSWREEARQTLPATIQQNMATVLSGDYLYSYGVNVQEHYLAECYFHTDRPGYRACNAILVSGKTMRVPVDSNYVGAAVSPAGARVVWFSQVGPNGKGGKFFYLFNGGGGWNGSFQVTLGGYGVFAYVYATFKSATEVVLGGQLHIAEGPGRYAAGIAQFKLGETPAIQTPLRIGEIANSTVMAVEDVWRNRSDDGIHVLARTTDGTLAYFHKGWSESWDAHRDPLWMMRDGYRGRFLPDGDDGVYTLVGRSVAASDALTLRRFSATRGRPPRGALRWDLARPENVELGAFGIQYPGAIYVQAESYQNTALASPRFAVCGNPWSSDEKIVHFRVR